VSARQGRHRRWQQHPHDGVVAAPDVGKHILEGAARRSTSGGGRRCCCAREEGEYRRTPLVRVLSYDGRTRSTRHSCRGSSVARDAARR
jgi:hypothetical protein